MTKFIVYGFGLAAGVTLIILLEIFTGITVPQVVKYYSGEQVHSYVQGSRGDIPDFSVEPVPVNVFEEIGSEWLLTGPDQLEVDFESMKGKVLFLSRWATWCGPCIIEMPEVAKLRDSLPREKVAFVLYTEENEHIVREFENEYDLPIYNSIDRIPEYLNVASLPQTFIIDKKGVVRYVHSGMALWSDKNVVDFMKVLAAE